MIEYDPQPPFDAGALTKVGDDVIDPQSSSTPSCASSPAHVAALVRQTAVAQKVSPRALLASVATSTSAPRRTAR